LHLRFLASGEVETERRLTTLADEFEAKAVRARAQAFADTTASLKLQQIQTNIESSR
jgi:hypothetical protein